jgi:hypothetical protein
MAWMHAFMAKSGKNIATLPNSKNGRLAKTQKHSWAYAKLPLTRAGEVVEAGVAR